MIGTIKNHFVDKGFGFIRGEDNNEYFFHSSSCISSFTQELGPGKKVTFETEKSPRGPRAINVVLA